MVSISILTSRSSINGACCFASADLHCTQRVARRTVQRRGRPLIVAGCRNSAGLAPIDIAISHGHADAVQQLALSGARLNARPADGVSPHSLPLHVAAEAADARLVALLLSFRAAPNAVRAIDGRSPLLCAVAAA